jgi:hypothetical protein
VKRQALNERAARKECWLAEALKRCQTEQQRNYVRTMDAHCNTGGEWYAGRERRARLLPPAKDERGRGRPNKSGHLSLMGLDKLERELVELGVLATKPRGTTNGHLDDGARRRGIKVLRSANSLMRRVLMRFGFFFGRRFRRSKSKRLDREVSRSSRRFVSVSRRRPGLDYDNCTRFKLPSNDVPLRPPLTHAQLCEPVPW